MNLIALYPGTFDPIHMGHVDIATRAAALFEYLVVGVYDRPNKKLLFTTDERVALVREALAHLPNVEVRAYQGLTIAFAQALGARVLVRGLRVISDFELEYQLALTNRQLAPELESVCLMTRQEHAFLSSSLVKEIFLLGEGVEGMVPPHVRLALELKRQALTAASDVTVVSLRD